jgi:hypothetical protein
LDQNLGKKGSIGIHRVRLKLAIVLNHKSGDNSREESGLEYA